MAAFDTPPAFTLPAALQQAGYALRTETDADIPFLVRLYASTREQELAPLPWSADQKSAFIAQQFQAQRFHYYNYIPNCRFDVLEHRGDAIGRLYLDDRPTQLHVVDIALVADWRGRGVGTAILQALQAAGQASGRGVGLMVEHFNPAMRLYRRLGFTDVQSNGVHIEMEWRPQPPA